MIAIKWAEKWGKLSSLPGGGGKNTRKVVYSIQITFAVDCCGNRQSSRPWQLRCMHEMTNFFLSDIRLFGSCKMKLLASQSHGSTTKVIRTIHLVQFPIATPNTRVGLIVDRFHLVSPGWICDRGKEKVYSWGLMRLPKIITLLTHISPHCCLRVRVWARQKAPHAYICRSAEGKIKAGDRRKWKLISICHFSFALLFYETRELLEKRDGNNFLCRLGRPGMFYDIKSE